MWLSKKHGLTFILQRIYENMAFQSCNHAISGYSKQTSQHQFEIFGLYSWGILYEQPVRQAFSSPWPVSHQVPVQPKVQPKRLLRLLRLLLLEVLLKKCCVLLGHNHHIRTVIIMDLVFAGEYHVCWLAKMFPLKCVPNKVEKYVLAIIIMLICLC